MMTKKRPKMPRAKAQPKADNVANDLASFREVSKVRWDQIDQRLESGNQRFNRLEHLIWGLYGLLISATVLQSVLGG